MSAPSSIKCLARRAAAAFAGTEDITPFGSLVWVTAIVVLVISRHAPNIRRILGREESTITKEE